MNTLNQNMFVRPSCKFKFLAKEGFYTPYNVDADDYDDFVNLTTTNNIEYSIKAIIHEVNIFDNNNKIQFDITNLFSSQIIDVNWNYNTNGEIIPILLIEPLIINGRTYTSCAFDNVGMLDELIKIYNTRIGDDIYMFFKADGALNIYKSFESSYTLDTIKIPKICRYCSQELIHNTKLFCDNTECKNRIFNLLLDYLKLSNNNLDDKIFDFFTKNNINSIHTLKKCNNIPKSLQDIISNTPIISKQQLIDLCSLKNKGVNILNSFINIDNFTVVMSSEFNISDMVELEFIDGPTKSVLKASISTQINKMKQFAHFVTLTDKIMHSNCVNKKFCFTNSISRSNTKLYKSFIVDNGGVICDVSKELDYIVTNDTEIKSTKLKKVKKTNTDLYNMGSNHVIRILSEDKLKKLIGYKNG